MDINERHFDILRTDIDTYIFICNNDDASTCMLTSV